MKCLSLAVVALLTTRAVHLNTDTQASASLDQQSQAYSYLDAMADQTRFLNSDGDPITLAQTEGHARLVLSRTERQRPGGEQLVQICNEDTDGSCITNKPGEKTTARLIQSSLEDFAYITDIYVGNPPQKIRALFDTGSTNAWVLNDKLQLPKNWTKQYSFKEDQSKTVQKLNQSADIKFGSGTLGGHFYIDDFRIGSCDPKASQGQIHIKNQKFGSVEKQSHIFTGSNFEAIIGMGYPALAEQGVKSVFDAMMEQKLLKSNVFSFYFTTKQAEKLGIQSDMTIGYYDKAKYKGDMKWYDVKFKYMFGVQLDDILINGKSTGVCQLGFECLITFDSGTSLMMMPSIASDKLKESGIPLESNIVPCKSSSQFGEMTLVIGGDKYTLSNEEWMYPAKAPALVQNGGMKFSKGSLGPQMLAQVSDAPSLAETQQSKKVDLKAFNEKNGKLACASTIMTMNLARKMFLVGDIFMRKYYTVFDRDNNRVGLAEAVTNDKIRALNQEPIIQAPQ